jgi:hypothetical protein
VKIYHNHDLVLHEKGCFNLPLPLFDEKSGIEQSYFSDKHPGSATVTLLIIFGAPACSSAPTRALTAACMAGVNTALLLLLVREKKSPKGRLSRAFNLLSTSCK